MTLEELLAKLVLPVTDYYGVYLIRQHHNDVALVAAAETTSHMIASFSSHTEAQAAAKLLGIHMQLLKKLLA